MTTFVAKPSTVRRDWFLIDATDKVLGRLAVEIARRLRGKHKPEFTPHVDTGDYIVVVNAAKLRVTGKQGDQARPTTATAATPAACTRPASRSCMRGSRLARSSSRSRACCPKGPLGYAMVRKLKVYAGAAHPHAAQQPKTLELNA